MSLEMNIEGTGPQWFADPLMAVEVVRPTHPGTVVGWLIFSLVVMLLLGYLYLRFYMKKSISVFCEETRGWMDTNWQKIRAFRGFIET